MGMDIHAVTQVRQDGIWVTLPRENQPDLHRNYLLFALLSGWSGRVGRPVQSILQNLYGETAEREPPSDLQTKSYQDYMVITSYYDVAGHRVMDDEGSAVHWYTLEELLRFDWSQPADDTRTWADAAGAFYSELIPWLKQQGAPEDVRLLFGFNS